MSDENALLVEWMKLAAALKDADGIATAAITTIGNALNEWHAQATDAGDERSIALMIEAWQAAQTKRSLIANMGAAVSSAAAVMSDLIRQRRMALEELEAISHEMESGNIHDPRLEVFAARVQAETVTFTQEAVYQELSASTKLGHKSLDALMNFVFGEFGELNSIQLGLLKAFIAALNAVEKGAA